MHEHELASLVELAKLLRYVKYGFYFEKVIFVKIWQILLTNKNYLYKIAKTIKVVKYIYEVTKILCIYEDLECFR